MKRKKGKEKHSRPWVTKRKPDGTFSYRIDRKHRLIQALTAGVPSDREKELDTLLRLIEESLPIQRIWIDTAENQEGVAAPFEGAQDAEIKKHLLICHQAMMSDGMSSKEAWELLAGFPPFQTDSALALMGLLRE